MDPANVIKLTPMSENPQTQSDWNVWVRNAIDISQNFEGEDPWANITGNFDGCYLTCGSLGFTWKYNNQPPMIMDFIQVNGEKALIDLMPNYGAIYIKAAKLGESQGAGIVEAWSHGDHVQADVKKELTAFWKSEGMIEIQVKYAWKMMGIFAQKKCLEAVSFFKSPLPQFRVFTYFFDQAVLNGPGSTIAFEANNDAKIGDILEWCASAYGYARSSLVLNREVWGALYAKCDPVSQALFRMAYLRAMKSRRQFMPVTMNRRGTLALGEGVVNMEHVSYPWRPL